jgi:hypothetical protein
MRAAIGGFIVRLGLRVKGRAPSRSSYATMSRSETRALLEERSKRLLGMSADDFEHRLAAGELPDTSTVRSLSFLLGETSPRA